jgi:predicted DNA-binding transcriptional regulator YafY
MVQGRSLEEEGTVVAIPREERILNLLSALLAASSPLPFSAIRGRVAGYDDAASGDAIEKRFDRDKADLRGLGVPLEYVAEDEFGRSGYRVEKSRYFLDEIRFTMEEGIVLAALERAAGAGAAVDEGLRSALGKLGVDSPLSEALRESAGEQHLLDPRLPHDNRDELGVLATLAEALAGKRPVCFSYYTLGSGTVSDRVVEPFGVGYFHGHWYLVGRDRAKGAERVFRTSRIRGEVEVRDADDYEIPADFNLRDRVGVPPWRYRDGPGEVVAVRFAPEIAWMIEENLQPGQTFTPDPDGGGVLAMEVTEPGALVRWIAQYGPDAEILEPPTLREAMREYLLRIIARCER